MSDNAQPPPSPLEELDIETSVKIVGALIIALYVLGLLAVNGYLFSLGASDFSLMRPRFVYTGALIMICGLIFVLWPLYGIQITQNRKDLGALQATALRILAILMPMNLLIGALLTFNHAMAMTTALRAVLLVYAAATVFSITSTSMFSGIRQLGGTRTLKIGRIAINTYLSAMLFVLFVSSFMYQIFPRIPNQYGGGQPELVTLLVKHDEAQDIRALGIPMESNSSVTHPVNMVYEGSDIFVLRLPDNSIVRLNRDTISAVRIAH